LAIVLAGACELEPSRDVPLDEVQTRIERSLCGRSFECPCRMRDVETMQQCQSFAAEFAENVLERARRRDLVWDPTCLGVDLERIDESGCDSILDTPNPCDPVCHYLHGSIPEGAECNYQSSQASDCSQGLRCVDARCRPPCWTPEVGTPCNFDCGPQLWCDENLGSCQMRAGPGESCDLERCPIGWACESLDPNDPTTPRVCKGPAEFGEPCRGHVRCQTGYCPRGYCEERPGAGESCAQAQLCALGLDCVDDVCEQGQAAVCIATSFPYYDDE